MKSAVISAAIIAALFTSSAAASGYWSQDGAAKIRTIKWLKAAHAKHKLNVSTEQVACAGANGVSVSYSTTTKEQRTLASSVSIRIGNKTTSVPAQLMTSYLNDEHQVVMQGFGLTAGLTKFELRMKMIATTTPKIDEVATYAGIVSVGSNSSEVICSATRKGAGMLKPQIGDGMIGGNLKVVCLPEGEAPSAAALPLINFEIARNHSDRLVSDLNESRGASDTETLPSFLVAQYSFDKAYLTIEMDDGSVDGNLVARLSANGVRVPTNPAAADPAIYGAWSGTYERLDVGRELKVSVDCYAF